MAATFVFTNSFAGTFLEIFHEFSSSVLTAVLHSSKMPLLYYSVERMVMPKRPKKGKLLELAPGELEILELLWTEGPVTLARTRDWFNERGRNLAVTTLHTRLNRLVGKDIVRRIAENPAMYEAAIRREKVSRRYSELIVELCGRNWIPLVAQLAENRDFTPEEIEFLENMLEKQKTKTQAH